LEFGALSFKRMVNWLSILVLTTLFISISACSTTSKTDTDEETPGEMPDAQVPIVEIIENPSRYENNLVTVAGEYRGWHSDDGTGPPVTRSDWVIRDDTGCIYVTGKMPDLDPDEDIGTPLEVEGTVRVTDKGSPYIEAETIEVE
jgi:hypothetical protein